jgi:hypothetical protein
MKTTLMLASALSLVASTALAQSRPETPNMTCASAAELVARRGAVILYTGDDTYDRYVRDQGFCEREQTVEPARVPTLDRAQCFVGYRCIFNTYNNGTGVVPP